jgi:hypothetical protein
LRPVEASGLTEGSSIKQLTAFGYAGSERRHAVATSDDYAIPASQPRSRPVLQSMERPPDGGLSEQKMAEYLRPYACFEAARAIGVHPSSLPFT